MDEAEKKESLKILDNLIINLNNQLLKFDKLIIEENQDITNKTLQLKQFTNDIVKFEEKINLDKSKILELKEKEIGIESSVGILENDIEKMKLEIEELNIKLKKQLPKIDFWYVLNHIFNPVGAAISDLIFLIKNNIGELESKLNYDKDEIKEKNNLILNLKEIITNLELLIIDVINQVNDYKMQITRKEINLRASGLGKTIIGNYKLRVQDYKTKCKLQIESVQQGKELLDIGIDTVNQQVDEFNSLCNEFDLKFNSVKNLYID